MITVELSRDYALIKRIITDPDVYFWLRDDFDPRPEDYQASDSPLIQYFVIRNDGAPVGLFLFGCSNTICWDMTVCMLVDGYGLIDQAIGELLKLVLDRIQLQRVTSRTLKTNWIANVLNRKMGMTPMGVNTKCVQRNGKLEDHILWGISRPEMQKLKDNYERSNSCGIT
jgi:hypothetical protein